MNERARLLAVPRDNARIASAALYVDGAAIAKLRGRDLRYIRIPAGLANGTLIRIADNTNRGVRLATRWIIHGCQPHRER